MANWRLAESLKKLREQINAEFPNRSKVSDGFVGDVSHSARASDHNPNDDGVVTAADFTSDERSGCTGERLAAALVESRDARIKYIIFNRMIFKTYPSSGRPAWRWHKYTGANAHSHHVHVSVSTDKSLYDSKVMWDLDFDVAIGAVAVHEVSENSLEAQDDVLAGQGNLSSDGAIVAKAQPQAQGESSQTVESGGAATQVLVQPNALTAPAVAAPIVSTPGDTPIEATTGSFKSMVTAAVGWMTGAGAGLIALLKDNKTLLVIAAVILVIAGVLYFIRQLILDRDRLKIASDPTKYSAK